MELIQLYPTPDNAGTALPTVDVVLVHGLDSRHNRGEESRIKTWTAEDGTVWPRDMLPKRMPEARVLCYEYNGSIKGTTSIAGIWEHALTLLQRLNELRRCGVKDQRPIIFVGHSLGGVIIKQALILARYRPLYRHLGDATRGIVFFATPHRLGGSDGGKTFATRLLQAVGSQDDRIRVVDAVREAFRPIQPSQPMIEEIETNSGNLYRITADFLAMLGSFKKIFFVNFIEATITEGLDGVTDRRDAVVVNQADASLDGADNQFISGNHVNMCKFSKNEWERFRPVWTALKRLADEALGNPNDVEAALLTSLCAAEFHEYSSNIRPTRGTGWWIEKKREFQAWRDHTTCKLWIYGKPAAGKTYLAKHIVNQLREKGNKGVIDCFLNASMKERNSCEAILRATIHQLATQDSELWALAVDRPRVREPRHTTMDWTQHELANLWPDIMAEAAKKGSDLTIVVDGFDEIRKQDQNDFLDCFETCERRLRGQARRSLRIIVLSRWCSSLANSKRGFVGYEIGEDDNAKDIRCTVQKELEEFADHAEYSDEFQEVLCDAVTRGAKGIYLWATIMIADIGIRMPGKHQLQQQLKKLPKSLAELYDSILGNIELTSEHAGTTTLRILRWAVFGLEPLGLQELNLALTLAELWEEDCERVINQELIQASMIPPQVFKASLYRLCGQLLSLSATNHVQPVHSTLTQYLTTNPGVFKDKEWKVPNHETFHLSEQAAHHDLGRMCAAYLMMPSFAYAGEKFSSTDKGCARWEIKVQDRIDTYPLVRYAALCWLKHVNLAGPVQPNPENEVRDAKNQSALRNMETGYGTSWFEVWWFARMWRDLKFPGPVADFEAWMEQADNALVPPVDRQVPPKRGKKGVSLPPTESVETLVDAENGATSSTNPPPARGHVIPVNNDTTGNAVDGYGTSAATDGVTTENDHTINGGYTSQDPPQVTPSGSGAGEQGGGSAAGHGSGQRDEPSCCEQLICVLTCGCCCTQC